MDQSLLSTLIAGAIVAIVGGLPGLFIYLRFRNAPLLPEREPWRVPWNGLGVFVAFAIFFFFLSIAQFVLNQSGFFQQLYGPDFPRASQQDQNVQAEHVRAMWGYLIAVPIQIVLIVVGFQFVFSANLSRMGLGVRRFGRNYLLGYFGWLLLAPTTLVVFAFAVMLTPNPQKHPLLDLGPWRGNLELILFSLQAAIVAPINEELLFRGLLLSWLLQPARPAVPDGEAGLPPLLPERRADACVFGAALLAFWLQKPALEMALAARQWGEIFASLAPLFFVVLLMPIYFLLPYSQGLQRRLGFSHQMLRACLATSILFASIHSSVWPSPVPLLVLALGMGWLTIRTRSIIPAITVHMLFNGVAVVTVWLGNGT